jgi:uncharacterized protein involved in response to NO
MLYNTLGGVAISFLVSALKNWAWAKGHPKIMAAALVILAQVIPALAHAPWAASGVGAVAVGFVTPLFAAIGTHEAITQPIKAKVNP